MSDLPELDTIEPAAAVVPPALEEPALEYAPEEEARVPLYDQQTEARLVGYTWPEINDHLDGRISAALAAGYTEREVHDYLRIPDQQPLQDRLRASWLTLLGDDPAGFVEPPPKPMMLEPLEGMAAARIAAHAGQGAPEARMPVGDEPPFASSFSLADQQARRAYVDALLSGEARSPLDFAERYTGAFWGALSDRGIQLDGSTAASLVRGGREMAATLPSNEELTDTAIALAHASSVPMEVGPVDDTKANLADYWAETGTPPMEAYREAAFDPLLEDALTSPPPAGASALAAPPEPLTPEQIKLRADLEPSLEELQRPGRDRINPVSMFGEPVEHKTLLGDLEDLGITVIVGGVGGHYVFKAGAYVVGSIIKSEAGQWVTQGLGNLLLGPAERAEAPVVARAVAADIAQAVGRDAEVDTAALARTVTAPEIRQQSVADASLEPVVRPPLPAVMVSNEQAAVVAGRGGEMERLRLENTGVTQDGMDSGGFFQRRLAQEGEAAAEPGAVRRLLSDESGAAAIPSGPVTQAISADLQAAINRLGRARREPPPELPPPPEISAAGLRPIVTGLDDELNRLRTNATADKRVLTQMVERMPPAWLKPELQEKVSEEVERRMLKGGAAGPYSSEVREVLDGVKALTDRQRELGDAVRAKLAGVAVDDPSLARVASVDEGYVHRVVKGREGPGSIVDPRVELDVITGGSVKGGQQRTISKFAPGMQSRSLYVLENEDGARVWGAKPLKEISDPDGKKTLGFGDAIETATGQRWTVKPATMAEVEANTDIRYHKNFLANTIENVARLERVNRNLDFLATTAKDLETQGLFVRAPSGKLLPPTNAEGMAKVELPGMIGWANPKIAYVLNDFFDASKGDLEWFVTKANRFIIGSLFISPVVHAGNVGMHWAPGRGWDWVKPAGYGSLMKDGVAAVREVWTQGPRYIEHLREGSGLLYASTTTENFHQMLLTKLFHEQTADPKTWGQYAKSLGVSLADLVKAEYRWSRKTLWAANDMFMLQRQFELERQGLPMREAIRQAEKDIPNYRVPSEVMGSHAMSEFLKSPNIMNFGRYKYGQIRALALVVDDLARGSKEERIDAVGKLTMLGAIGLGFYPLLNNGNAPGPIEAHAGFGMKAFGPFSLINAATEFTAGQKDWLSSVSSFVGLSPMIDIARRFTTNRDVWGRKIVDDKATWVGKAVQGLEAVGTTFPPSQMLLTAIKDGDINRAIGGLIGTTFKKPVDEAKKSKWDQIEQARAYARERGDNLEQWVKRQLGIADETTAAPKSPGRPSGQGRRPSAPRNNWGNQ